MTMLWKESFDSSRPPHLRPARDVAEEVLVLLNYLSGERVCGKYEHRSKREERGSTFQGGGTLGGGIPAFRNSRQVVFEEAEAPRQAQVPTQGQGQRMEGPGVHHPTGEARNLRLFECSLGPKTVLRVRVKAR